MKTSPLKTQVGGSHYKRLKIQPVEFCQKNELNFCESSAIGYLCRHRLKGKKQDLEKAIHFIQLLIEIEYPESIIIKSPKAKKKTEESFSWPKPKKWPSNFPRKNLPKLPIGKTRWIYVGTFANDFIVPPSATVIYFWNNLKSQWVTTASFSHSYHHIVAV